MMSVSGFNLDPVHGTNYQILPGANYVVNRRLTPMVQFG